MQYLHIVRVFIALNLDIDINLARSCSYDGCILGMRHSSLVVLRRSRSLFAETVRHRLPRLHIEQIK